MTLGAPPITLSRTTPFGVPMCGVPQAARAPAICGWELLGSVPLGHCPVRINLFSLLWIEDKHTLNASTN
jgi:hypothetical protein